MAKIIFGAHVTEMRGSIGGQYYQASPHGFVTRKKPSRVQVSRLNGDYGNGCFRKTVAAWRTLSAEARQQWRQYLFQGNTGFQAFVKYNVTNIYNEVALQLFPAVGVVAPSVLGDVAISFSPGHSLTISFQVENFSPGWEVLVKASQVMPNTVRKNNVSIAQYYSTGLTNPFSTTLGSNYSSARGTFPGVNTHFFIYLVVHNRVNGFWAPLYQAWLPA